MSTDLGPLVFEPLYYPKPWGGRRMAELLGKALPGNQPIGESWELVSLPGAESRVRSGRYSGFSLQELVARFGRELLGEVELVENRFPLLIKFLDARENLSVQVHPRPTGDAAHGLSPGVKHEAWYVLDAKPGAELLIGARPGATPADFSAAAGKPEMVDLLQRWPAQVGQCYYLPSGTPHALGAGVLVAEVQTPSDVTYRLYDWDRVGLDGKSRELHLAEGLKNTRFDVGRDEILQAAGLSRAPLRRVATCSRFVIDERKFGPAHGAELQVGQMHIWIILAGTLTLTSPIDTATIRSGETVLLPARMNATSLDSSDGFRVLDITIPAARP